ncbi:anti-sigma factor antagonist [Candidatus Parcubacteria bacterium]|nr:MAG: anti-sigma factor antagonist [Candidatus Parcubacteria bacterium]
MPLTTHVSPQDKTVTISIDGHFDFRVHREFRQAYEQAPGPDTTYVIDLHGTEYIDSSALGMLLLLREYAGGERANVYITNCTPAVQKILTVANFHRLFHIT